MAQSVNMSKPAVGEGRRFQDTKKIGSLGIVKINNGGVNLFFGGWKTV